MANEPTKQGTARAKTKKRKPIKVNGEQEFAPIKPTVDRGEFRCTCCGKVYERIVNFPISNSPLFASNEGRIPICRNCMEKYYSQLVEFYSGNEVHAMEHLCRIFDWYFSEDAFAMTRNVATGKSRASIYPSKMNLQHIKRKGTTYIDTLRERYGAKNTVIEKTFDINKTSDDATTVSAEEDVDSKPKIDPEVILFFGTGYTNDEYAFLTKEFEEWTTRYECSTKAQQELFKNICITQVNIQRAQTNNNAKEVSDAMKIFQDLLGSANLKPSQLNENALADQNTLGTLIKYWEQHDPISDPTEEWKDVDGIYEYVTGFYVGHSAELLHIKNDVEELYHQLMAKYTVNPPSYDDDEFGDTSLIDKYSNKKDKENNDELP